MYIQKQFSALSFLNILVFSFRRCDPARSKTTFLQQIFLRKKLEKYFNILQHFVQQILGESTKKKNGIYFVKFVAWEEEFFNINVDGVK